MTVDGDYAFVTIGFLGIQIIDISDPHSPTLRGSYETPGWTYNIDVSGNYAYINYWDLADWDGFLIIDISKPGSPTLAGSYESNLGDVTVAGNYAYTLHYSDIDDQYGLRCLSSVLTMACWKL